MEQSNEINIKGGGKIGRTRATWPFVNLIVNRDRLQLKASILGNFVFLPSDIISITPASNISLLGSSIQINHTVEGYSSNIIFQYSGSSADLINKIHQTGFLNNADPISAPTQAEIIEYSSTSGFPIKIPAIVAIIIIWNICCIYDFRHLIDGSDPKLAFGGIGIRLALGFMITICLSLLFAEPVRTLVLKKGRNINDIKPFLYFIIVICVFMMAQNLIIPKS